MCGLREIACAEEEEVLVHVSTLTWDGAEEEEEAPTYFIHPLPLPLPLPPPHGKKERDGMKGVQTWARGWEKDSRHIFLESLFVLFLNLIL